MSQTDGDRLVTNPKVEALLGHVWLQGRLKCIYTEPDRKNGETVGYYKNGALRFKYPMGNGDLHGTGQTWYEDGTLQGEEQYYNGQLHGVSRQYYPDGQLVSEANYRNGLYHGSKKEWHKNGELKSAKPYIHDRLHGAWIEWYENSALKMQMNFVDGLRNGFYKKWDTEGKLISKLIYVRNTKITNRLHALINDKELTAQDILKIRNSAVRRICLEELGYARFLSQIEHEIIDKDGEYELVRVDWHKREESICLVKVKCSSTGAYYTLRVPPHMETVKQAVAWTFHMKKNEYNPLEEA